MQPDGGGAGTAVVDEDNGAALFVFHAAFFVVGEEDLGFDLALVLVLSQKERSGRGGIVELCVSQFEGVLGRYSFLFFGNGRIFDFFFVFHKCPLFNESGKAHEGYGQKSGGKEGDRHSPERLGDLNKRQTLPNARHQHEGE